MPFLNCPICYGTAPFSFILISGFACFLITPALPETLRAKMFPLSKHGLPDVRTGPACPQGLWGERKWLKMFGTLFSPLFKMSLYLFYFLNIFRYTLIFIFIVDTVLCKGKEFVHYTEIFYFFFK